MPVPRLYLITPPVLTAAAVREIGDLLGAFDIACVRLALATRDEAGIRQAADALRGPCRDAGVELVIAEHFRLAASLGLDGVHLADGARHVREARRVLGPDAIVGAHCGASRHEGMTAAEIGADYVSFGPVAPSPLGDGTTAPPDLFAWWAEMIETPLVAEGGLTPGTAAALARSADFLALGDEIWSAPGGPRAALAAVAEAVATEARSREAAPDPST